MRGVMRDWSDVKQGRLTVIRPSGRDKFGAVLWLCRCECGAEVEKSSGTLAKGVKSCSHACGVATSNKRRARHGMYRTKEYRTWIAIRARCYNPNTRAYAYYGGRGISVCDTWRRSFDAFLSDVGVAPHPRASLDRIDNNGDYCPDNVRWATPKQQMNNTRANVRVSFRGGHHTLAEIAAIAQIPYHQVWQRYTRGLEGEDLVRKHKVGRKPKT